VCFTLTSLDHIISGRVQQSQSTLVIQHLQRVTTCTQRPPFWVTIVVVGLSFLYSTSIVAKYTYIFPLKFRCPKFFNGRNIEVKSSLDIMQSKLKKLIFSRARFLKRKRGGPFKICGFPLIKHLHSKVIVPSLNCLLTLQALDVQKMFLELSKNCFSLIIFCGHRNDQEP